MKRNRILIVLLKQLRVRFLHDIAAQSISFSLIQVWLWPSLLILGLLVRVQSHWWVIQSCSQLKSVKNVPIIIFHGLDLIHWYHIAPRLLHLIFSGAWWGTSRRHLEELLEIGVKAGQINVALSHTKVHLLVYQLLDHGLEVVFLLLQSLNLPELLLILRDLINSACNLLDNKERMHNQGLHLLILFVHFCSSLFNLFSCFCIFVFSTYCLLACFKIAFCTCGWSNVFDMWRIVDWRHI